MAEIYLARSVGPQGFEKLVVLKKILPHLAENPKFVRLFLDEAKLAAGLDHSHIAHVYDMGTVDGNYFFTMEYVHGQDVRSILRRCVMTRTALPIEHAVLVARNVAAALHYAHERRSSDGVLLEIVHRDVSPSNILVSYGGEVKLVDFGVAKAATSSMRTRTGALKGKVSYMSPEQGRGAHLDRRSDVYSLGIVLWEMITCRRLYKADNDLATIQQILNQPPSSPSRFRRDCPPELEAIILRALAQPLDRRYQNAQELQLELEEFAREHKLGQSSIALSAYLHSLFAAEIRAWKDAQLSGITLTDHVLAVAEDPTTSDDLSFEDVDAHVPEPAVPARPSELTLPVSRASTDRIATAPIAPTPADLPGPGVTRRPARWSWIIGTGLLAAGVAAAIVVGVSGDEPAPAPRVDRAAEEVAPPEPRSDAPETAVPPAAPRDVAAPEPAAVAEVQDEDEPSVAKVPPRPPRRTNRVRRGGKPPRQPAKQAVKEPAKEVKEVKTPDPPTFDPNPFPPP